MEDFDMSRLIVAGIILVVTFGGALVWKVWTMMKPRLRSKRLIEKFQHMGIQKDYFFGKYLFGLNETKPRDVVRCGEAENDFVFFFSDKEIGRIPVNDVSNIFLEDKSKTSERYTATRFATLGIFALAFKKKKHIATFYVTIEWKTGGLQSQALFEFKSFDAANMANINLKNKIAKVGG